MKRYNLFENLTYEKCRVCFPFYLETMHLQERLLQLLKFTSQEIIIKIAREYVHSEIKHLTNECANEILQTQNRFRRIASATWEIGDPAQDAIAFQLDSENSNVFLHGVGIYLDAQNESKWKKPFSCHLEVIFS